MTPTFFLTICLGGILCLTPLAVYLVWLSALNRKPHPTVVTASWDFVALLVGLAGFLFCVGVMLATAVADLGIFTRGPFNRLAVWLPWINLAWFLSLTVYLLLLARAVRKGLAARRHSVAIYNIDEPVLSAALDEALLVLNLEKAQVRTSTFPVFRHAVVTMPDGGELEKLLRQMMPRLPAADDNPAAPWISSVTTITVVAVCCCIALVVAMPFLK